MSLNDEKPLDATALTLSPATDADMRTATGLFQRWDDSDGRFIIRAVRSIRGAIVEYRPTLDDEWLTCATREGPIVQVRRADCGAGCRCAGEFRFVR
jgi:hypothetical protein